MTTSLKWCTGATREAGLRAWLVDEAGVPVHVPAQQLGQLHTQSCYLWLRTCCRASERAHRVYLWVGADAAGGFGPGSTSELHVTERMSELCDECAASAGTGVWPPRRREMQAHESAEL